MKWNRSIAWRVVKWLGWGLVFLLIGIPALFTLSFLGIQEATERQWLGKAPSHEAIAARSSQPHQTALLDVGFDSLAERLRLIESAKQSIELEFFIYEIDTASRLITQALARRAGEGVKVRILVDFALPVFKLAPEYVKTLEAAGVAVRYYNTAGIQRFFAAQHRTHRKLLAVDRAQAIIGGRNMADEYFDLSTTYNFLDSDLLIEGPIVGSIVDSFELYWASEWVTQPKDLSGDISAAVVQDLLGQPSPTERGLAQALQHHAPEHGTSTCNDIEFVTDYPGSGVERRKVFLAISQLAHEARRQITVETPYLVLRDDGANVVRDVVGRGVQLRFLTNSLQSTDAFYTVASLADGLARLQLPKLEVWAYEGDPLRSAARTPNSARWGVHAKRAVFDDDTVVVGTYNIDPRSANLNSELIVICRGNPDLASAMKTSMAARLAQSRAIVGTDHPGGVDALIEGASDKSVFLMRAISPLASFLDFLM
ncbi:phosphatidylserine/phosphatidylglycerophosphate/cardiolipin synthase family protein [Hydrogenophaga sp. PAMC20947]|uniref:phospholipase D-like domain-containing protein n=1 Tax=Hydrogenophaga sp. PAMC20947 TaxID=2565558 RepID=UPI00109DF9C1|nr:phosphatidylserine/phosphatidylglycerophosphate/cardiolipin synthase family protein [Hydrogenophaga sp. PAMC20947]QCB44837.1 phosphatidylserine/phosphatidylglycerophosphate/cardiolipin synthase family protein [Hydrogenophaga sp. PAMC20947]